MGIGHRLGHLLDQVGMLVGEVLFLPDVLGQIVQLDRGILVLADVQADALPLAHADGLLASPLVKFPIEILPLFLLLGLAEQGRSEGYAVYALGLVHPGQFAQGGQKIPPRRHVSAARTRLDFPRPPSGGRHPDPSLVQIALVALERAVAVEEVRLVPPSLWGPLSEVKDDQSIVLDFQFLEQIEDSSNVLIHQGHHGGEGGHWVLDDRPAVSAGDLFELGKFLAPGSNPVFGSLHGGVRDGKGHVAEEGLVLVRPDELEALVGNQGMRVVLAVKLHLVAVAPGVSGVEVVGLPLAIQTVETIEALVHRIPFRARGSQAPLSEHARNISRFLENFGDRLGLIGQGALPFRLNFLVSPHQGVSGMHARHQAAPGGGAHRAGRIEVGQLHALLGHAVHARGLELFLSEAGKIPVPRIVDHDVNEVRLAGGGLKKGRKTRHSGRTGRESVSWIRLWVKGRRDH